MVQHKIVVFIGQVWPEPDSSAAGKRILQLIELFRLWNYKIIFTSTAQENSISYDLAILEIEKVPIQLNDDSFDDFIKKSNPDVVIFDRFISEEQFGWRVSRSCPKALKILDSEDLHCLRYTRGFDLKNGVAFEPVHLFTQDWTKREIASILRCDLTLVIAEFEMELLISSFKIDPNVLFYLPILYQEKELQALSTVNDFQKRSDFVFIGNFWHEPNWDAVLYLKKTVWPLIKKELPNANLLIYGAYPSKKVFDLHNTKEGFLVVGRAEELSKVLSESKVLLAPLRFGAGIKGKLLDAMQYGLPSITTSIGAESINGAFDWSGFVADNVKEMVEKSCLLYQDEKTWLKCKDNAAVILKNRFHWQQFELPFKLKCDALLQNLETHRATNFYGLLLAHHSLKSTEYLSRWIAEKNKYNNLTEL